MKLSAISRKIIFRIILIALIMIACSFPVTIFINSFPVAALLFSTGVILMSGLNCFKIFLLERSINKISAMDDLNIGKAYALLQYALRYFLTAIVAAAAITVMFLFTGESPFISIGTGLSHTYTPLVLGMILGLFTMKFGVISAGVSGYKTKPDECPDVSSEPVVEADATIPAQDQDL